MNIILIKINRIGWNIYYLKVKGYIINIIQNLNYTINKILKYFKIFIFNIKYLNIISSNYKLNIILVISNWISNLYQ